jgi:hypothetical protein
MSELSRREILSAVSAAVLAGALPVEAAQHVHHLAAADKAATAGVYKPKVFTEHEYLTLQRLADFIIPPDEHSGGANESGAPAFIDLLASDNPQLAAIYTGGIAWLDAKMQLRNQANFLNATTQQQTEMLDLIAYRKNASPELNPGIHFFEWCRKMVVDAFYTSPVGVKDLGYMGNTALAKFEVPKEAIEYALRRS